MALREMVCESQVLQWADVVFAPSEAAVSNVAEVRGSDLGIRMVREPFSSEHWEVKPQFDATSFAYFGRVSFAKGVDIFAGMMTAIGATWPVTAITFLGRHVRTSFRRRDVEDYLASRLHSDLKAKTHFLGAVLRERAVAEVGQHCFFANFSRSETFSYTTLEAISTGCVPLVLFDSPMAELFPEEIRQQATFAEAPHRGSAIERVLAFWRDTYSCSIVELQKHARELTRPDLYAAAYTALAPVLLPASSQTKTS